MLLDEIAGRLISGNIASSSGSGVGWYLWRSFMPDSTDIAARAVALIETGGLPEMLNLEIARPTFQVLVRGAPIDQVSTGYEEAALKAEQIKMDLHFLTGTALSGVTYYQIQAVGEPGFIGEDLSRRPMFSCNFRAWRQST